MKKLVLILALVACGKSDKKEDNAKTEAKKPISAEPAKPEPPKVTRVPVKAFIEADTATIAFKPQAVLGKKPADVAKELPQFLRKDKTSEAVNKRTEAMMADMKKEVEAMGVDTSKKTDVEFRLPPTPGTKRDETHVIIHLDDAGFIRQYGVWFDTTAAEKAEIIKTMDEVWGPHKVVQETLGHQMQWYDAKNGVRASTRVKGDGDRIDIDYVRYLPLAKFFGEPGPLWGFEKAERPFLGATVEQIQQTYAEYGEMKVDKDSGSLTMHLPPTDYDGNSSKTMILMFVTNNKVRQWNTHIPFEDYEPARAEYEAALDAKFGKPKPARREHLIYGKKPKVDVNYSKYTSELDIEVSP